MPDTNSPTNRSNADPSFGPSTARGRGSSGAQPSEFRQSVPWAAEFAEAVQERVPSNWTAGVRTDDVLRLAIEFGVPIVEHPPARVVEGFITAMRAGTDPFLLFATQREAILDDLASLARRVGAVPDAAVHTALLDDALGALQAGLPVIARRSALLQIDGLLQSMVTPGAGGPGTWKDAVVNWAVADLVVADELPHARARCVLHCAAHLLARSWAPAASVTADRHADVCTADTGEETEAMLALLAVGNLLALRFTGAEGRTGLADPSEPTPSA
jgi:hypothetical protein